jgi:hypothetical protein
MSEDQRLIFLVGAVRSGTYIVSQQLSRALQIRYIGEVNEVWKRHAGRAGTDYVPWTSISAPVVQNLRQDFRKRWGCDGGLVLEKTPANTLRLPLLLKAFPEAKYIYLERDGRDVAWSIRSKVRGNFSKFSREELGETPFRDRLYRVWKQTWKKFRRGLNCGLFIKEFGRYRRRALGPLFFSKAQTWGVAFPGDVQTLRRLDPLLYGALQWRFSVECARSALLVHPGHSVYFLKFEDFLHNPPLELQRLCRFVDSKAEPKITDHIVRKIKPIESDWRTNLTEGEKADVASLIEFTLIHCGYPPTFPEREESLSVLFEKQLFDSFATSVT